MIEIIQVLINSFVSGIVISLVAVGFSFIFRVTKVFHLAHGSIYVTGGLFCWWVGEKTNSQIIGVVISILIVSILIYFIEKLVYLPLLRKNSNQSISLVVSMGVYMIITNILAIIFGYESKFFNNRITGNVELSYFSITNIQFFQLGIGLLTLVLTFLYFKFSNSFTLFEAQSDNETLSKVFGINTENQRLKIFIVGSILACIAAILVTLESGIDPTSGMAITLTASVIAILVSRISISYIVFTSIIISFVQNLTEYFSDSHWRDGVTFVILLIAILFRTEGIVSYNIRKD